MSTPLSFGQERLWLLQQMDPASVAYNVPIALRFRDGIVREALTSALDALVERHCVLGSVVVVDPAGVPGAARVPDFHVPLEWRKADDHNGWRRHASELLARPFDLASAPPMRALVVECPSGSAVLCLVIHHIVTDGRSNRILIRDLAALYRSAAHGAPPPASLNVSYNDFVTWQRAAANPPSVAADLDYWRRELARFQPLDLPLDRPRPAEPGFAGDHVEFELSQHMTAALRSYAMRRRCAMHSAVAALFQALLALHSGQRDITIGSVLSGRERSEFHDVIGFFVNTVVLRAGVDRSTSFADLLRLVHAKVMAAKAHQTAPFEQVVAAVQADRQAGRNAIFDVMFVYHGDMAMLTESAAGDITRERWSGATTRFDLELSTDVSEGRLCGTLTFRSELFQRSTIERLANRFIRLTEQALTAPDEPLGALNLLLDDEAERIEARLRARSRPVCDRSLGSLFETQVARTPNAEAVVGHDARLTYQELDERANHLAHRLVDAGVSGDQVVGVLAERGAALAVTMLGIVKAGAAYLPLSTDDPLPRSRAALREAGVRVLLTGPELAGTAAEITDVLPDCVVLELRAGSSPNAPAVDVAPEQLAYVMYTSGSTGEPKGVAIAHRQVAELAADRGWTEATGRVLHHSPHAFDASTFEIWVPLLSGGCVVMAPPGALEMAAFERLVHEESVTCAWLTAGLFRVFAEERPSAFASLREVWTGGDVVAPDAVSRVLQHCPSLVVVNGYGPTETTTFATTHRIRSGEEIQAPIPIGLPLDNTQCHVLDRGLSHVPDGVVGELFVGGTGVGRGYVNRPDLTATYFVADPYGPPGSRMYRTGDLVRRRANGTLEFVGRADGQVKIRGFRIETAEVEYAIGSFPEVAHSAVVAAEDSMGDKVLVGYVVMRAPASPAPEELRAYLSTRLPSYMIPSAFVFLDMLPVTANGKLDRTRLPAPDAVGDAAGLRRAPRSPREKILCEIFGEVLGVAPPGIDDGFFELGGHSLLATRLTSRIRSMLGVEVPMRTVFEAPTVAQLALRLDAEHTIRPSLRRMVRPLRPPLSPGQRRLWFLSQLEGTAAYNIAFALRMRGRLDVNALSVALTDVVDRHEVLRTVFPEADGEPWQDVRPTRTCPPFAVVRSTEADVRREMATAARRIFDLRVDIPLRAQLFALDPDDHVLLLVVHHVAFDGWSVGPFWRELAEAYDARRTGRKPQWAPLPVQYVDYTLWQQDLLGHDSDPASLSAYQLKHWVSNLSDAPLQIALPFDRQRSIAVDVASADLAFELPARLHAALRAVARDHQVTLFMVLQAAVAAVLSRLGAGTDILLGTPIAGRTDDALDGLVGFFVNTLVLRTDVSGDPTFGELLARVRGADLVAYANQDLPFEVIVEALNPKRVLGVNPVFQVSLALDDLAESEVSFADVRTESMMIGAGAAKFDISVIVFEPSGPSVADMPLSGLVEYRTDLFDAATIEGVVARLTQFLESVTADPAAPITAIDLLTPAEHTLIAGWDMADVGGVDHPLPELLRRQANRTPDGPAVSCGTVTLTYRELDARATRIAAELSTRGVGLESPVVVAMERSIDLVVALMAIMKAGGHYVPLPAGLPLARVSAVFRDSGASILLVDPSSATPELLECAASCGLAVTGATPPAAGSPAVGDVPQVEPARRPENLAYVMYTSGSTGVPKGVAITDRDVATRAADRCWGIGPGERVLFHAPHAFDASVYELWIPLLTGGEVVVAPPGELDVFSIKELISAHAITTVHVTAGLFRIMVEECPDAFAGVREVLTGGDVVSPSAVRRLLDAVPGLRVRHLYGPTETTLCATQHLVKMDAEPEHWIPLGRPLDGARLHVLDSRLRLVPPGVDGELYIGGAGLARGYINGPGLTAERFVADPFGPAGSLMYRTGDLVRWTKDGRLRFIGRRDTQVKINGFRVEPGEIESVLAGRPDVAQAVVLARDDGRGTKRLLAYVVPAPGHEMDVAELRRFVGESLPSYMMPAAITLIDSLPLTSNAKVDWRALPEPDLAASGSSRGPRTLREQVLCRLFGEVLDLPRVGVDESFFDLGGHSLLAMKLISRIRTELHMDMSIRVLFEAPTVAALALSLDADPGDPFDMILPLRVGGTSAPVFFIHPIGGLSWCYSRFLPYIPRDHPVYGLQSSGYLGRSDRPESVEDIIAEYVTRIRELHPRGPYALAGWSFGGFMAHEIAAELSLHGDNVPVVVVLDAAPTQRGTQADDVALPADVAQAIAVSVHGAAAGMAQALTSVAIADLSALAEDYIRLAAGYESRTFDGQVLSIEASALAEARRAPRAPWAEYAHGGVITHVVDCTHDQMMDPATVKQTGPILAKVIRQRLGARVPEGPEYWGNRDDKGA